MCWALRFRAARARRFDMASQPKLDPAATGRPGHRGRRGALDTNNRRLVAQGLKRIRAGQMPGIAALLRGGRQPARPPPSTSALRWAAHQRGGRLADMTLGIECLLTDDAPARRGAPARRHQPRAPRDRNRHARAGPADGRNLFGEEGAEPPPAISVFDPIFTKAWSASWPAASRTSCTAPLSSLPPAAHRARRTNSKGSGRSIPGFHLRDALDLAAKPPARRLLRFGGHAMAAGCTVPEAQFEVFEQALAQGSPRMAGRRHAHTPAGDRRPLAPEYRRTDLGTHCTAGLGPGFCRPTFSEEVEVLSQRLVGERHLSLKLRHQGTPVTASGLATPIPCPAACCWLSRPT